MEPTFRASMTLLHSWAGVVVGALLLTIFWMGTLSVFDREIDRWMAPSTRLAMVEKPVSFDALRGTFGAAAVTARSPSWSVSLPTERQPMIRLAWRDASGIVQKLVDPAAGTVLPDSGTWAGTRFIYPFHVHLHLKLWDLGHWLVGLAGMTMLALCVSGTIIHRKILADFFLFRPHKKPRRLILDLHNVTGVLALPFHVAIPLSGLVVFFSIYFPSGWHVAYQGERQAFTDEAFSTWSRPRRDQLGSSASLDTMVAEAQRLWNGDKPRSLTIRYPGDAASYVQIYRPHDVGITSHVDVASFDGATGILLHRSDTRPALTAQRFIAGLHLIQFRHWTLRWLYFVLGLLSCVMIATGYLFWLESRRKRHAQLGLRGVRVVEGLAIGSVTGVIVATISFFVVNRLLPLGVSFLGQDRAALEVWTFYLVWLTTFGHAWLRKGRAWIEQCWAVASLAVAAVLLNWITTGDHLARSLAHRHLWAVGGMDLLLLAGAAIAGVVALKLQHSLRLPVRC